MQPCSKEFDDESWLLHPLFGEDGEVVFVPLWMVAFRPVGGDELVFVAAELEQQQQQQAVQSLAVQAMTDL